MINLGGRYVASVSIVSRLSYRVHAHASFNLCLKDSIRAPFLTLYTLSSLVISARSELESSSRTFFGRRSAPLVRV